MRTLISSLYILFSFLFILPACHASEIHSTITEKHLAELTDSLHAIIAEYPGEIGIGFISDRNDTIAINNHVHFPMMSVFKLHQGMALCNHLAQNGISVDSLVKIPRKNLNASTWSPMLREIPEDTISISISRLMKYSIEESDNNASNYLFDNFLDPEKTESYISTLIPDSAFRIRYTEADMLSDHRRAYENYTSPLSAAELINRLYTDSVLLAAPWGLFIRQTLDECKTGTDRIVAPLLDKGGVKVGHKTGSGFRDKGLLAAHNDVAFIRLPDGRHYSLAIFVKDFSGPDEEASRAIARISSAVYEAICRKDM